MSEYDLFAGLSDLEEKWILQPRKLVSPWLNLLFCFLAANVSALIPDSMPIVGVVVYFASFGVLYAGHCYEIVENPGDRHVGRIQALKPVLEFIDRSYKKPITLEDLARLAGMSPRYFCRFFYAFIYNSYYHTVFQRFLFNQKSTHPGVFYKR